MFGWQRNPPHLGRISGGRNLVRSSLWQQAVPRSAGQSTLQARKTAASHPIVHSKTVLRDEYGGKIDAHWGNREQG